jgi:L-threonylcarbamoyladenylate synthase
VSDLREAAERLRRGAIAVFPTETLVGLGCDARLPAAMARVVAIKGRPPEQPFPLLLPQGLRREDYAHFDERARRLAALFWPGTLTLVLPAGPRCLSAWTARDGTVALRQTGHPVARELVEALGAPLVATSANRSGQPAPASLADLDPGLAAEVDLVLSDGAPGSGAGSTIVRIEAHGGWRVLREGRPSREEIEDALRDES